VAPRDLRAPTASRALPEEVIARDYLLSGDADVVLNVVDATNLERNL